MGRHPFKGVIDRLNKVDKAIAERALEKVDLMDQAQKSIGALSGGQQQRALIARTLTQEAELFLLDEPFVGVDAITKSKVVELIKEEAQKGNTVLIFHRDLSMSLHIFIKSFYSTSTLLQQAQSKKLLQKRTWRSVMGRSCRYCIRRRREISRVYNGRYMWCGGL
jgi:ABC-type Mn2+/Zn2+ transport system ATPase subunit